MGSRQAKQRACGDFCAQVASSVRQGRLLPFSALALPATQREYYANKLRLTMQKKNDRENKRRLLPLRVRHRLDPPSPPPSVPGTSRGIAELVERELPRSSRRRCRRRSLLRGWRRSRSRCGGSATGGEYRERAAWRSVKKKHVRVCGRGSSANGSRWARRLLWRSTSGLPSELRESLDDLLAAARDEDVVVIIVEAFESARDGSATGQQRAGPSLEERNALEVIVVSERKDGSDELREGSAEAAREEGTREDALRGFRRGTPCPGRSPVHRRTARQLQQRSFFATQ